MIFKLKVKEEATIRDFRIVQNRVRSREDLVCANFTHTSINIMIKEDKNDHDKK